MKATAANLTLELSRSLRFKKPKRLWLVEIWTTFLLSNNVRFRRTG